MGRTAVLTLVITAFEINFHIEVIRCVRVIEKSLLVCVSSHLLILQCLPALAVSKSCLPIPFPLHVPFLLPLRA